MQLTINRELLLKAINLIAKAADKRHNMVILGNIRLEVSQELLVLTASDLEVELMATLKLPAGACIEPGSTTLPAIKLKDICKLLPAQSVIQLAAQDNGRCLLTSGKSRFTLGTLPAKDYPTLGNPEHITPLTLSRHKLSDLMHKTLFAMAIQDVRYYLTGMLFEVGQRQLTTVATDGHRLALARAAVNVGDEVNMQAILPRKAVIELERLSTELAKMLSEQDNMLTLSFGREFLQVSMPFGDVDSTGQISDSLVITFTARLIDGKFPDYRRVIPNSSDKLALVNREKMTEVLRRVSILSNEKSRSVVFNFAADGNVEIRANNAEQDEAVENLQVKYNGDPIELSFNAAYLQDVLDVVQGDVQLHMSQANASVLVNQLGDELHQYVIMPMRI
ncbi:DNA polymerase III subunit beta [Psychrobacter arenosus]|jgi:DNA polymerase-3 subunit beta|uniref:DNA polymerase III subunit beta n=1 Tax=Psychrobacter arenosus TaxID=256326 RepID=UPI001917D592|nr:DNA polymerase III subunit beta [Psychrobacter arenosus]